VNTTSSRTWQAFVTRYNVLYNAREAYQTTYQTALDGTTDDYTLRLPLDPVLARATLDDEASTPRTRLEADSGHVGGTSRIDASEPASPREIIRVSEGCETVARFLPK